MAVASLSWTVWPSIAITGARGSRPLMAMLLDVSRQVGRGAWGRSGRHYGWGGSSTPLLNNQHCWIGRSTNTTQQSTIYLAVTSDICHEVKHDKVYPKSAQYSCKHVGSSSADQDPSVRLSRHIHNLDILPFRKDV